MALTPRGFEDICLDNLVTIANAYVAAQKLLYAAAHPTATPEEVAAAVGFTAERDRMTPPTDDELKAQALVIFSFTTETPNGGDKTNKKTTASINATCFAAMGEGLDNLKVVGDKGANSRLLYLKAQVEAALFNLGNYHLGFAQGVIARKSYGRWNTTTGVADDSESWVVSGQWVFDIDYEWTPESPQGVALEELSVDAGRWSALYQY